jgi:hypothetical protein
MLLIRKKKPRTDPPRPPEPPAPLPDPAGADWADVTLPPVPTRRPRRAVIARDRAARMWKRLRNRS